MTKAPTYTGTERRTQVRRTIKLKCKVATKDKSVFATATDLSSGGCFVETGGKLVLAKGTKVEITFVINFGVLQKMHRREGTVKHISRGGTGFAISPLERQIQQAV